MENEKTSDNGKEFSGSLSWNDYSLAIDQFAEFSQSHGECWERESPYPEIPGGSFLSHSRFAEVNNSLLKLDELCTYFNKSIDELSQLEHPLLHVPYFCLHPCHTSEILKTLSQTLHQSPLSYFVAWLSLVAQVLRIPLPNEFGSSGDNMDGGGDTKKYSAPIPRLTAGLFLLKNLNSKGEYRKLDESELQNPDYSNHETEVAKLLTTSCARTFRQEVILKAITLGKVTEPMISLVSANYPKLFTRVVEAYIRQLLSQEETLKAMNYYLLIDQHEQAIQTMLLQKEYYRQALILAKLFLDSNKIIELTKSAAIHFFKIGSYSIATELLCSIGNYSEALASLEKLNSKDALGAACFLASKLDDQHKVDDITNRILILSVEENSLGETCDVSALDSASIEAQLSSP